MPFFSVIIPSYNRAGFLPATIRSVLNQDFSSFEIIVIDDGSTDPTKEIVQSLSRNDARIKYFYKDNAERGAARNFGMQKAEGEFVIFLDSDDEFLSGHLKTMHEIILKHPKLNFYATKFDFIEEGVAFKSPIDSVPEGIIDYTLFKKGNPFACNICIRRNNPGLSLFLEERIYAGMEDWIFLFTNTWSQDLFLSNQTTVRMNEHPNRSMRFNKIIVEKRLEATKYLLKNFALLQSEKRKIRGYTSYFCAIHTYLDNERKTSLKWVMKSMMLLGIRNDLLSLMLKLFFGNKLVGKIKGVIHHK